MRVFTATLATESNTFSPLPTGLASFRRPGGYFAAGTHPEAPSFFAGPLFAARQRAREHGWTLIEGMVAMAQPGGTTTAEAWQVLRDELLRDLRAAMPVEMVLLGLHGAMVAAGCDDVEGDLLAQVRAITGPGTVIGAALDPHHHLTALKLRHADLLVAFKHYPHDDVLERAFELVDLCAAAAAGHVRPVPSTADCGMLVPLHTSREPGRGFVERIQALEGRDGVLSISITHGFPWADVEALGTRVLVYTHQDAVAGRQLALRLARELISLRHQLAPPRPDVDAALDLALACPPGPVLLADSADNPGGGAPGDSTHLLRRIVERRISPVALGPLWDPLAVRIAFEAGVGARLPLRIGGKVGPLSGQPVDLDCEVRALKHDMVMGSLAGTQAPLGDCALVESAGVRIVLCTEREQALDMDLFTQLGCELTTCRLVVLKSSQHFYASFSRLTDRVLYVAAPGVVSDDLSTLPYTKLRRRLWPIDPDHQPEAS